MSIQYELKESFETRTKRLGRELERAIQRQAPAILLVVYASEWVREEVERELRRHINDLGQKVVSVRVDKEHGDIPVTLDSYENPQETVFLISGLQWGGGEDGLNAYRSLNLRREWFIEKNWRVVFWLTERETVALARQAPDFWAFRHRVIEFVEPPETGHRAAVARELAWRDWSENIRDETDAKIGLRESLLAELPENDETLASRLSLLITLGGLYWAARDYAKAEQAFKRTIELDREFKSPISWGAWSGLGGIYSELGQIDDAIQSYQRAIEFDPTDEHSWNNLGKLYSDLGQSGEAVQAYQKAIELAPKYTSPWNGLGNLYKDLGQTDQAIMAYEKAIELDPAFAYAWQNLGNAYRGLGQNDNAIKSYQRAIELPNSFGTPTNAHALAWNGLGIVYYDLGQNDDAIKAYQKAIELDPIFAPTWNGLGVIYRDLGQNDQAIQSYQKSIELDPKFALPWYSLGTVYLIIGDYEKALSAFTKAREIEPDDASYRASIVGVLKKLRRESEATELTKIIRPLMEKDEEYSRACFEAICGNLEEALRLLKIALEKKQQSLVWVRKDPDFDNLRDDPRFKELVGA
jgi:tetratricopeptide (TPR) repeat protein